MITVPLLTKFAVKIKHPLSTLLEVQSRGVLSKCPNNDFSFAFQSLTANNEGLECFSSVPDGVKDAFEFIQVTMLVLFFFFFFFFFFFNFFFFFFSVFVLHHYSDQKWFYMH